MSFVRGAIRTVRVPATRDVGMALAVVAYPGANPLLLRKRFSSSIADSIYNSPVTIRGLITIAAVGIVLAGCGSAGGSPSATSRLATSKQWSSCVVAYDINTGGTSFVNPVPPEAHKMLLKSGSPQFKSFGHAINQLISEAVDPHSLSLSPGSKLSSSETQAAKACLQLADVST
jgi:hypothetical protein